MNRPEFRVRKTAKGWIVEYKAVISGVLGFKYIKWLPFTTYSGLTDAYPFKDKEGAINDTLFSIRSQMLNP